VENVWINGSRSAVKKYELAHVHISGNMGYVKMLPFDNVSGGHHVIAMFGA
jgi:hypothetical protein